MGREEPPSTDFSRSATARERVGAAQAETFVAGDEAHTEYDGVFPVPARIGRYRVQSKLGEGGMGVVLAAYDERLGRRVALKLVRARRRDARATARVLREARALARLSDPNVVEIFDVATHGEDVVLAMELVEAQTVREWLGGRPPLAAVLEALAAAGRGLRAAHRAGLVHRDFKPDNVLVGRDGRVRVVDFGLARSEPEPGVSVASDGLVVDRDAVTTVGMVVGTPAYMAPEQHAGDAADARADQYAFCVTAWEAIFGARPFQAATLGGLVRAKARRPTPPARAPVSRRLVRMLVRGLSPRPDDRHRSMDPLIAALGAARTPSRANATWMLFGAAIATLASTAFVSRREPSCADRAADSLAMWDEAARARVADNIARSGGTGASRVARSLTEALDERTAVWRERFEQACVNEAAATTNGTDVTMGCLMERRRELVATVQALSQHASAGPTRAQDMVDALRSIDACDPTAGAAESEDPDRNADPAMRERLADLRDRLAEVDAAAAAGAARHALALAHEIQSDARELRWPPVLIAAGLAVASNLAEVGEDGAARRAYEDAYYDAQEHGLHRLGVTAANALARLCAYRSDCSSEARGWVAHAEAGAQRLDDPTLAIAVAISSATVLNAEGDTEGSLRATDRGLALEEGLELRQPLLRARLLRLRGEALREAGRPGEALEELERARGIFTSTYLEDHPRVVELRALIATVRGQDGDSPAALAELEAILRVHEANAGPDSHDVGRVLVATGVVRMTDDPAAAVADFRRATKILDATLGTTSLISLNAHLNLGSAMAASGDIAGSVRVFREVLDRSIESAGPDHRDLAHLHNNLALSLLAQGDLEGARAEYENGLRIASLTAVDPEIGVRLRLGLADALNRVGDSPARADRLATEGLDTIAGDAQGMTSIRAFVEQYHPTLTPALDARGW